MLPNHPKFGATAVARKAFAFRTSVTYDQDGISFPSTPSDPGVNASLCALTTTPPTPRIDFGDTKYRLLQFQCTASTRYAEYYNPADVADGSQTTLVGTPTTTTYPVLCTANGPIVDVAYVVPIPWQDTSATEHTRSGGGLDLPESTCSRPATASFSPSSSPTYPTGAPIRATRCGPTFRRWASIPLRRRLRGAAQGQRQLHHAYVGACRQHRRAAWRDEVGDAVRLQNVQQLIPPTVVAVGHAVHYSEDRQLWYTDVELDIGGAYAPFVKLAVARYQPNSVPGTELSNVVRIDCLQLASSRTAAIARSGTSLVVTVSGPSAPNRLGLNQGGALPGSGHVIKATIETA